MALVVALAACAGDGGAADPAPSTSAATTATTVADDPGTEDADAPEPGDHDEVPSDPSAGCGRDPDVAEVSSDEDPGDVAQTLTVDGVERTYRLGVPAGYDADEPAPFVLNLHGSGSDGLQAGVYGDVPHAASDRGVVAAAPDAIDGQWEITGDGADAAFLEAVADDVADRYCIDQARMHVLGMSLGAFRAAVTACASDRWASAALVTVEVFPGTCDPLPVVALHGTADPVAAYGPGGSMPDPAGPNPGITGVVENMAAWAENGGCAADAEQEDVGPDVVRHTYPGCDEGVDVVLYSIEGGGHTWPGSAITIGPPEMTTQTVDATEVALDWFAAHPRRR